MKSSDRIDNSSPTSGLPQPVFILDDFKALIEKIKQGNKSIRIIEIRKLLCFRGLINHYKDKNTGRCLLAACKEFAYPHEFHTAKKLTGVNYDVVLVPDGYFKRHEKKFDVFLTRDHIFLESDLKCITTKNPDTIGKRIKEGSEQSSRIVLDITSNISKKELIVGLKTGCERNAAVKEILLFYKTGFYCLAKTQVLSKKIFNVLK